MAQTIAAQITVIDIRIARLHEQIQSEEEAIHAVKRPLSLVSALLSPKVRQQGFYEISRSRDRLTRLSQSLANAQAEKRELELLQIAYPELDHLIEQEEQHNIQVRQVTLQEDQLDLADRKAELAKRLEAKRLREEKQRIQQELAELALQQEKIEQKRAELQKSLGTKTSTSSR